MIGTTEIIIIALVILVLFGAAAIPRFARSLGQAKKEFDKGAKEGYPDKDDGDTTNAAKSGEGGKK